MGYAYSVYGVDLKKLKPTKDKKLFDTLRERFGEDWTESDEWFDTDIVEKGAPIRARAVWELLYGKPSAKAHGFQYGYALEDLCKHFGKRIDEESLTWFDEILDPLLKRAKAGTTRALLRAGASPIAFPKPKDFPEFGTLTAAECTAALGTLSKVATSDDENTAMVVDEVRGWFTRGKAAKGLAWFLY